MQIDEAAAILFEAQAERRTCALLTERWGAFDLATAYAIQDRLLARRLERGEKLVGLKLGLTSRAKQVQMKVEAPITAWLTDAMRAQGDSLPRARLIHPRAEPEIVFVMGRRLAGPGVSAAAAFAAVAEVHAGIEIIDSRYANFRFTLADVVADNASGAYFVLGEKGVAPGGIDPASEECVLLVDGKEVARATGAAVLGHPAEALALAANELAGRGKAIEAGWVVMTGALTEAVTLGPGQSVSANFTHLGRVEVTGG